MSRIYLDYNATTPTDKRVLEAMMPYLGDVYGNPSSIHSWGSDAKAALDTAREKVASMLGAKTSEIVFTASGSESNNYAIKGAAFANRNRGNHLVTTSIEHASSYETFRYLESEGFRVTYVGVDNKGNVDPEDIGNAITDETILVSCIYVNNETGVILPVSKIGEIAHEKKIIFHTDAIQAAGKMPINLKDLPVDLMSISSHKIYGPKGTGALFIRKGTNLTSLIHGGGQERGKRSGTENVAGIVGMGKACEIIDSELNDEIERLGHLRDSLYTGIKSRISNIRINGDINNCVCNTVNISLEGIHGESLVMNLDIEGIAASTGSACSEGNVDPSHVLMAMGQSREKAVSSLRLSIGRFTTQQEIDRVIQILPLIESRIRNVKKNSDIREIKADS